MTSKSAELDERLVSVLHDSPRASVVMISKALQEPRSAVARQLKDLMDSGAIRVVTATHPEFSGMSVIAHVSVVTRGPVSHVTDQAALWPEAVFISVIAGTYDVIMEVRVRTHDELQEVLTRVRAHHCVARISTVVYAHVTKGFLEHKTFVPIRIDDTDRRVLDILQQNGRIGWQALAVDVGLSPSAVSARVRRMLKAGIASIVVVEDRGPHGRLLTMGVGLSLSGDSSEALSSIGADDHVQFAAATIGRFDAIATVHGSSPSQLHAALESLRESAQVTALDAWTHLHTVKEDYARRL